MPTPSNKPRRMRRLPGVNRPHSRHYDYFYLALLAAADATPLPELYEIFGKDAAMKFLHVFAGTSFKVPSPELLKDCIRDAMIYAKLREPSGRARDRLVEELGSEHDLDRATLLSVRRKMHRLAVQTGVTRGRKEEASP